MADQENQSSKLQWIGVLLFGIAVFFVFLVLKLPEARIQNLVIAHLRIIAQEQGMYFNAEKVSTSLLFGPSLKLENVELKAIEDEKRVLKIPELRIRPQIFSMMTATKKAKISGNLLEGAISGVAGASNSAFAMDMDLRDIQLGSSSLLKGFLPIELGAKINGQIRMDLDFTQVQKSNGKIDLQISKLTVPPQSVFGFNLPQMNVNESKIEISIAEGKFAIRTFKVGGDPKTDDLTATITGDGTLDRNLDQTRLNGKAVFQLSQKVSQSFPLLDALLQGAKTPDGKYQFRLTGPLSSLEAQPGG